MPPTIVTVTVTFVAAAADSVIVSDAVGPFVWFPSVTDTSLMLRLGSCTGGGAGPSSVTIVTTPVASPIAAPDAPDSPIVNISLVSAVVSPLMTTVMVRTVTHGPNVSEPLADTKSEPAVADPAAVAQLTLIGSPEPVVRLTTIVTSLVPASPSVIVASDTVMRGAAGRPNWSTSASKLLYVSNSFFWLWISVLLPLARAAFVSATTCLARSG